MTGLFCWSRTTGESLHASHIFLSIFWGGLWGIMYFFIFLLRRQAFVVFNRVGGGRNVGAIFCNFVTFV